MAFTSGSATNYNVLLDTLKTYLVAQGWTVLAYTAGTGLSDVAELHIQFPGVNSFTGVLNIITRHNTSSGFYGWEATVSRTYSSSLAWGTQFGDSPSTFLNMWDASLGYWFYVNDRRLIMSIKVSAVYTSAFWGMFLPFTTPDEYNYPYYVGSNYTGLDDFSNTTAKHFIASPTEHTSFYLSKEAVWMDVGNYDHLDNLAQSATGRILPHGSISVVPSDSRDNFNWMKNSKPNAAGEVIILPCHIVSHLEKKMIGNLDGVFGLPGFGKGTEQVITFGSRNFRIFQDLNRSTDYSFMALEEL